MERLTDEQLLQHAREFDFYPASAAADDINKKYYRVTVTCRSPKKYALEHMGNVWDGSKWEYETSQMRQAGAIPLFDLQEAVRLALQMVETVRINGRNWSELQQVLAERNLK